MTSSPRTLVPSVLLGLTLALTLSACGDDEPSSVPRSDTGSSSSTDEEPTQEDLDALSEGFEDATSTAAVETVADSVVSTLGLTGWSVDGDEITFTSDGSQDESGTDCPVIGSVMAAFEEAAALTVVVDYSDGSVTCEGL